VDITRSGQQFVQGTGGTNYDDLIEAEFVSETPGVGKRSEFTIDIRSKDKLRGAPAQIRCQPNWWLQVVLNLRQDPGGGT
jgi:hypothetical protein